LQNKAPSCHPLHFAAEGYTLDQLAMLKLLGNPPVISVTTIMLFQEQKEERDGVPSIAPSHVVKHPCPVVVVLDRQRAIMPNGDLHSQD
jgi:kynurenine formamidase